MIRSRIFFYRFDWCNKILHSCWFCCFGLCFFFGDWDEGEDLTTFLGFTLGSFDLSSHIIFMYPCQFNLNWIVSFLLGSNSIDNYIIVLYSVRINSTRSKRVTLRGLQWWWSNLFISTNTLSVDRQTFMLICMCKR